MTDPLELLDRVVRIADMALKIGDFRHWHAQCHVPESTLRVLIQQVEAVARKPCASADERVIGDEAVMMMQALLNAELHTLSGDVERGTRWRTIAGAFTPFLRSDLARLADGRPVLS